MALDGANYISELQAALPANTDPRSEGASQIRSVKRALQLSFPNIGGEVDATHTRMNEVFNTWNLPVGLISMWSGLVENIPNGWAICDGSTVNGQLTPNLMGKFIKGASYETDGTPVEDIGDTGGDNNGSGLIELPDHTHDRGTMNITGSINQMGEGFQDSGSADGAFTKGSGSNGNTYAHQDTSRSGSVSFNAANTWEGETSAPIYDSNIIGTDGGNQPEYYNLAYIMFVGVTE